MDDHLTTAQVATRLGLTRTRIIDFVNDGSLVPMLKLPGYNGAYVFTEDEVARFEKARA